MHYKLHYQNRIIYAINLEWLLQKTEKYTDEWKITDWKNATIAGGNHEDTERPARS